MQEPCLHARQVFVQSSPAVGRWTYCCVVRLVLQRGASDVVVFRNHVFTGKHHLGFNSDYNELSCKIMYAMTNIGLNTSVSLAEFLQLQCRFE